MTQRYDEQYEISKEGEIKVSKGIKKDLTDCVTKVVGEVAMKVCFALTVAFCIGC
jgi:tartrate dehydratase alpha subunit/fumarate hydratase class I-like protein